MYSFMEYHQRSIFCLHYSSENIINRLKHSHNDCLKYIALGESVMMTNITLTLFHAILPLNSHLMLYIIIFPYKLGV